MLPFQSNVSWGMKHRLPVCKRTGWGKFLNLLHALDALRVSGASQCNVWEQSKAVQNARIGSELNALATLGHLGTF